MPLVTNRTPSPKWRKVVATVAFLTAAVLLGGGVFLASRWPFRREAVLKDLQGASLSKGDVYGCLSWYVFPPPGLPARTRHFPAQSETWDAAANHHRKDKN